MGSESEHPALKGFSETWESVKHVGGSILRGAAKGAMWTAIAGAGLALLAAPILLPAMAGSAIIGGLLSMVGLGSVVSGAVTGVALAGAAVLGVGAGVGGLIGGLGGVGDVGEKVDEKKQQMVDNYERNQMREERMQAIEMRRMALMQQQGRGMGLSPDALPGQGLGANRGMANSL